MIQLTQRIRHVVGRIFLQELQALTPPRWCWEPRARDLGRRAVRVIMPRLAAYESLGMVAVLR
ncbi:MAG: hypothetical protein IPM80_03740 [Proteobacteria bacterium]|nr:hypothetical protein [Pseudomonadota bacterium]